ncbi:MAG: NifB/NifX family molybdenum-iron cluster-binding protein [Ignavibacteriae bacterium]|nr:hypothetical protein [Ignavibacteriota bacterium]NOG97970.1 NifB/NifX family molybdenum-iron cluster-binding protein [Ignavibacteriota bacterium]
MKKIIIPAFGSRISPRLDFAKYIHIIEVDGKKIIKRDLIQIITQNRLNRIQQLIKLSPDVIICDGLTEMCLNEFKKAKVEVVPWVNGEIEEIIKMYLEGKLESRLKIK